MPTAPSSVSNQLLAETTKKLKHGAGKQELRDPNSSKKSSDLSLEVRRETEEKAMAQLERARQKPVAFALRTNVAYNGSMEENSPVHKHVFSFGIGDYMHIKEEYDDDWWIGRLVKEGCDIGFIPRPAKLENLQLQQQQAMCSNFCSDKSDFFLTVGENNCKSKSTAYVRPGYKTPNKNNLIKQGSVSDYCDNLAESDNTIKTPLAKEKKKPFFKKAEKIPPYEVVPLTRPIVLLGPSLKGYEVTDLMQKAILDDLKRRFEGRIIVTRTTADISLSKFALTSNDPSSGATTERTKSTNSCLARVRTEIERIYKLASTLQLVVLRCDTINHPSQLLKTSLAPLFVYVKISSPKVLRLLVKSRGMMSQSRNTKAQMMAADKLSRCNPELFDVILNENQLREACDHLAGHLEAYWHAIHPPQKILPFSASPMTSQLFPHVSTHVGKIGGVEILSSTSVYPCLIRTSPFLTPTLILTTEGRTTCFQSTNIQRLRASLGARARKGDCISGTRNGTSDKQINDRMVNEQGSNQKICTEEVMRGLFTPRIPPPPRRWKPPTTA